MSGSRRDFLRISGAGAAFLAMAGACSRPDQRASNDLAALDAVETAARINSGDLSAGEAVEAAIERAERVEPRLNAIVEKTYDRARDAAAGAQGLWAGVPTFVKDLDDVTGAPTRFGSRAYPDYLGRAQTPLVNAYLGLGVVSLGKSTTPEFGLSATTEPVSTGATRNPWNTDYSPGGSSGGAAALVAAGVVPVAHASDGGGSIRIPASCCGNVGLKVSRTRFPQSRPSAGPIALSVHGVQTRTVRDTAAVLAAMELPPEESGLPPVGLVSAPSSKRLKMALVTKGLRDAPVNGDVMAALESVAALCADLGHTVEPFDLPLDPGLEDDFLLYWAAIAGGAVSFWESQSALARDEAYFEKFTLGLAGLHEANQADLAGAVGRLQEAAAAIAGIFTQYDAILSPVVAAPPPEIGYLGGALDYATLKERLFDYVQFPSFYNVAGNPAISLPLSMSSGGLPIGAMFAAAEGDERTLLELSYELEEASPWAGRRPAVFG